MKHAKRVALAALVVLSCSRPPTVPEKKAAAEATYGADLQLCVHDAKTPAEADACAEAVRARWSKDGGTEGGAR